MHRAQFRAEIHFNPWLTCGSSLGPPCAAVPCRRRQQQQQVQQQRQRRRQQQAPLMPAEQRAAPVPIAAAASASAAFPAGDGDGAKQQQQQQQQPARAAPGGLGGLLGGRKRKEDKLPMQQRVLNGILNVSNVPYSSFVPYPVTPLHRIDAQIKQLWLVAIYVLIARATPWLRVGIAGVVAALTMLTLPRRLWEAQLKRLALICGLIFVFTAIGADGVPPLLQARAPPCALEGLPPLAPEAGYSYVLCNLGIITVTRRSVNLAVTAAALTFCALQSASLCLVTTPGEEMAVALQRWLAPLRLLRVPTQRIGVTLLLSLRFMSLVFEEVRNLCLGLAARGVDWRAQGGRGAMDIAARLLVRLFANLFARSENIAQAMVVRGFLGPEQHHLYMMRVNETSGVANAAALLALVGLAAAVAALR